MPAANMCRLIKLTEKRNQASRAAADGALQESCNEDEGDIISSLKEKVPKSSLEESGGENLERVEGLPNGFGESRCSESGAGAGMVVGDIEEAKGEVEEGINSMKEVENCGKREADLEEVHEIKSEEKTGAFAKFVLFCSVLFCSVLFCSVLFCSVLFCSVLFCSVLFCSVLFCSAQYYSL